MNVDSQRRVVSVMADGLIVVHDDASEEEIDRAFQRIVQFVMGDVEGLRRSAPRERHIEDVLAIAADNGTQRSGYPHDSEGGADGR